TCVSCGTCLQVCPTGALVDKRSAFMGRDIQTQHIKSSCTQCSIGCGMEIVTRDGNVLRIEGDWDAPVNAGLLCQRGRFDPLYDARTRITKPLVRENGQLKETDWDTALQAVAKAMKDTSATNWGVVTTTYATNEALYLLNKLFRQELGVTNVGLLNDAAPKVVEKANGSLVDINNSDIILLVGADPANEQPVASFFIKRALNKGARLAVVDDKDNGLAPFASMNLNMADIEKAIEIAQRATNPVVLFGSRVTGEASKALQKLSGKAAFIALEPGVNTRAAVALGLNNGFDPSASKALYVLLGEQDWNSEPIMQKAKKDAFIVMQASYRSPLTERADVVLPMATWAERTGTVTNTEGRVQKVSKAVEPKGEAKPDWEILALLASKMGKKFGTTLEEASADAVRAIHPS
ncbi:MAG: molybdopterin-dependent oxidoreductase, partial [Chloroflexi bacterium]|nr:molybdopterin-dependent oxidoreductase [Chloroflexota bacterium]